MQRGNDLHKKAANYLSGKVDVLVNELRHFATQMQELRGMEPLVEQQWGFTSEWKPTGWFGADVWYRGVVDAGVIYPDDTADIVDHKTGKKYAANEDQMEIFALSAFCRYPALKHVTARLWYLDSGDEVVLEYDVKVREPLKAKWEAKVRPMFGERVFGARPNDKCRWCVFSASAGGPCRFG